MKLPKQIVDDHVPYDKTFSEAFLYRFTNLLNGRIYVGIRKGQPYDGYMFSSKCKEFHKDFMNPNSKWKYEVLNDFKIIITLIMIFLFIKLLLKSGFIIV